MSHSPTTTPFTWRAWPARERPRAAMAAGAIIIAIATAAGFSFGWPWGIASIVILGLSLNRFFLPSRFTIDDRGITARYPLRRVNRRWSRLRRFVHDRQGGYLSTRSKPSRADAFSGLHVLFGDDRTEAIERIRAAMDQQKRSAAQATSRAGGDAAVEGGRPWAA